MAERNVSDGFKKLIQTTLKNNIYEQMHYYDIDIRSGCTKYIIFSVCNLFESDISMAM